MQYFHYLRTTLAQLVAWSRWCLGFMPRSAVGNRSLYLIVHYAFIGTLTVLLSYFSPTISDWWGIPPQKDQLTAKLGPGLAAVVGRCWWGVLFLLAYGVGRLIMYILELLNVRDVSGFPDIDRDWDRALEALAAAKIDLARTPVYLVNGLSHDEQKAVLAPGQTEWTVEEPRLDEPDTTVRVLADRRAAYVCLSSVGATALQRANVSRGGKAPSHGGGSHTMAPAFATQAGWSDTGDSAAPSAFGTQGGFTAGGAAGQTMAGLDNAPLPERAPSAPSPGGTLAGDLGGSAGGGLSLEESAFGGPPPSDAPPGDIPGSDTDQGFGGQRFEAAAAPQPGAMAGGSMRASFASIFPGSLDRVSRETKNRPLAPPGATLRPLSEEQANLGDAQTEYVCSLLSEARGRDVPVDGVLQAVPVHWTVRPGGTEEEGRRYARELARPIGQDLACIHETLELQMPVIVLLTGLQSLPGWKEFSGRCEKLSGNYRRGRGGQRFPPGADVDGEAATWLAEGFIEYFRGWVYRTMAEDIAHPEANRKLFAFYSQIARRRGPLAELLSESLNTGTDVRLYGLYAAATGSAEVDRGLSEGVLARLAESRKEVAWDVHRVSSASRNRVLTGVCLAAAVLMSGAAIWFFRQTQTEDRRVVDVAALSTPESSRSD